MKKNSKREVLKSEALLNMMEDLEEAKKKAEESEARFRALINATDTGYVIIDAKGVVLDANSEYVRLTGRNSLDEIKGRSVVGWTAKYDLKRNAQEVKKCFKKGFVRNLEIDYIDKHGKAIPIEINASAIKSEKGPIVVTLCRDITKRKRTEETYRDLIENANDLIQSVDINGKFAYVNEKWRKILGYSDKEVKKLHFTDILRKDQIPHCINIFKKLCKGHSFEHVKTVFVSKKGKEIFVSGNINAQFKDGKFIATRGLFRDITKQKRAEEKLLKQKEKYEKEINELRKKLKKRKK